LEESVSHCHFEAQISSNKYLSIGSLRSSKHLQSLLQKPISILCENHTRAMCGQSLEL